MTARPCLEELERRLVPSAVVSTSTNWSGYAVTAGRGAVTDVAGQWVVPAVTGTGTAYSSAWVGIDGFNSPTVEQIGTDSDLVNGMPQYYAWYEMYPSGSVNLPLAIHAGDTISADVSYACGKFALSIKDVTTGKSYTTSQTAPSAQRSSAEWIMEAPSSFSGVLPMADFGKATFSEAHATVSGKTGAIDTARSGTQLNEINMVSQFGATEDTTSGLTDSGSPATSSFTVAYTAATSTPPPSRHHRHWWWFGPDQGASSDAMTPSTAAASLNVVGPGALNVTAQPAPSALVSASQPAVVASLVVAASSARGSSLGPSAAAVAAYRLSAGDAPDASADRFAGSELLQGPGESGAPGEPVAPPSDNGTGPISDGPGADVAPGASSALLRTFDTYFVEASWERSAASEGPAALTDRAAVGATAAAAAAAIFLTLALNGSWCSPTGESGARRHRLRLAAGARR
jgi:hypothetical protein